MNLKKLQEDFAKRTAEEETKKKQDEIRFQSMGDPRITYDQYRYSNQYPINENRLYSYIELTPSLQK